MTVCPHPEKTAHRSIKAALKARDSLEAERGLDIALRPYKCPCGSWHLGHRKNNLSTVLGDGRRNAKASRRRRTR